jgi:ATP-binding cassette subfamily B protein
VQAIQIAHADESVLTHLRTLNNDRRKYVIRDRLLSQVLSSIYRNAGALGTGLILILVAESLKTDSFSMGDFALFVYNLGLSAEFFADFGDYLAHYKQAGVSFDRMAAFIRNKPPEMPEEQAGKILVEHNPIYVQGQLPELVHSQVHENDAFHSIVVEGLTYHYPGNGNGNNHKHGIQDVDLHIERGDFVVITGRIGSGKSTLLKVLLGLLPLDSGCIYWNDQLVTDPASFFVPPRTAYTSQIPHLFSETLANNILMGLPESQGNLDKAIYQAVLEDDIDQLPDGKETMVGTRGVKLSGGQRQRVAAARMFVRDPELLVFDDLSSALDVKTERNLWQRVFEEQSKGNLPTCLVVSHRHLAFNQADQILVMKDGKISDRGTVDSLLKSSAEFRFIWGKTETVLDNREPVPLVQKAI